VVHVFEDPSAVQGARTPRALIITPGEDPRIGGVERFGTNLATALGLEGWVVDFAYSGRTASRWAARLGLSYAAMSRAAERAIPGPADLIVTNGFLGPRAKRSRHIHVFHGTMVGHSWALRGQVPLRETFRGVVCGAAAEARAGRGARIVAVSDNARQEVERFYRLRVDFVVPNGIDTDVFRPRPMCEARAMFDLPRDAPIALFVGRLEPRKGSQFLEPAVAAAGYELVVAGPTAPGHGTHLGSLHQTDLALAYNAADVVILPTTYEACSYVVLETLASGTPLITTDVGWMRRFLDAIPQYREFVIEPSARDLTRALGRLRRAEVAALTAAGRAYVVTNNDLRPWARTWISLIDEVMANESAHLT
jgi:glycosyltransferase involved in cell wall biosynthesis